MKKTYLMTIFVLIICGIYFFKDKESIDKQGPSESYHSQKRQAQDKLSSVQYKIAPDQLTNNSILPQNCHESFLDLSLMLPKEFLDVLQSQGSIDSFFSKSCQIDLQRSDIYNKYAKSLNCNFLEFDNAKPGEENQCLSFFLLLKAYAIKDASSSKNHKEMSSVELAANFATMFYELDSITAESLRKNILIMYLRTLKARALELIA